MSMGSIGGIYGLSGSGMDIDSLVKKLMAGQQAKEDSLVQRKTVVEWQKTAFNTVYDDISNFRSTVFNYKLQSTLIPNKVSSSNEDVVKVTANAGAANINHSLVVNDLAKGVNLTSSAEITPVGADKTSLATQFGISSAFSLTISDGLTTKTIDVDTSESINKFVSDINNSGLNMKANYDSTMDRFFLSTTNTGIATQITLSSTTDNPDLGTQFIQSLKIFPDALYNSSMNTGGYVSNPISGSPATYKSSTGNDASFTLDGTPLVVDSNTFTISDVTYNLIGVSPIDSSNNKISTTLSVTSDIDAAVANIQSFVDSYNKILTELNSKLDEKRYADYLPLTEAQKAAMKESDVTVWTDKAMSGMLHHDATLTNLVNTMRNAVSNPISGITATTVSGQSITYDSAASIGITTGIYTEGGKLYLNTNKLRTALQNNPDVLTQIFGSKGTTTTVNGKTVTDTQTQGIAGRLYDGIKATMDKLVTIAGTTGSAQFDTNSDFAKRIKDYNTQISSVQDRFDTIQSAYYKQFNAMEVALSQLNSQSSWLSSQLSNKG